MSRKQNARRLTVAGMKLAAARGKVRDAMYEVKQEILLCHEDGMPIAEIARRAGVTRQTVYDILESQDLHGS